MAAMAQNHVGGFIGPWPSDCGLVVPWSFDCGPFQVTNSWQTCDSYYL